MARKATADNSGLIPVRSFLEYDASDNPLIPPKKRYVVQASNGTKICTDINPKWAKYIAFAINNYHQYIAQGVAIKSSKYGRIIGKIEIPGEPVPRTDGKMLMKDEDGNFVLSSSLAYSQRVKNLVKNKAKLTAPIPVPLPLQGPLHIQCTFHVTSVTRKFSISDLSTSALDILRRIGVIEREGYDIVASMDGTMVKRVYGKPKTIITIRRYKDVK